MAQDEEMPEYKELDRINITDLEESEDGYIVPRYQFGDEEIVFEPEQALVALLLDRIVFLNSHWWIKDWPKEAKEFTAIHVNCSDVFAWGSADAETLPHTEIENLYDHYRLDSAWGPAVWCIKQRGYMPQKPVYDAIQALDIWDLDKLDLEISIDDRIQKRKHEEEKVIQTSHLNVLTRVKDWIKGLKPKPKMNHKRRKGD